MPSAQHHHHAVSSSSSSSRPCVISSPPHTSTKSSSQRQSSASRPCILFLGAVIALQWFVITLLLYHRQEHDVTLSSSNNYNEEQNATMTSTLGATTAVASSLACSSVSLQKQQAETSTTTTTETTTENLSTIDTDFIYDGVFVTVLFRAPKWFHLRYTAMIHNALANLPSNTGTWRVQVFYNQEWMTEQRVLDYHPGMRRLMNDDRIIWTRLPTEFTCKKCKPKQIPSSRWFWEHGVQSEQVVMFSGNGAFCGNHHHHHHVVSSSSSALLSNTTTTTADTASSHTNNTIWDIIQDFDYIASPWYNHHGMGGDGTSHSFRRRSAMLAAIDYAASKQKQHDGGDDSMELGGNTEHAWIVGVMMKRNQDPEYKSREPFRLATKHETFLFGGVTNISNGNGVQHVPLVAAGTHGKLTYDERETLLKHCPELKSIFPSMHEPACFGAHPNPDVCKATICALQDKLPSSGC